MKLKIDGLAKERGKKKVEGRKPKYKKCDCDIEAWEEIIVKDDDHYSFKTVIYYHCQDCDEDVRVEDFYTGEILEMDEGIK
jgi:hypothetical protein